MNLLFYVFTIKETNFHKSFSIICTKNVILHYCSDSALIPSSKFRMLPMPRNPLVLLSSETVSRINKTTIPSRNLYRNDESETILEFGTPPASKKWKMNEDCNVNRNQEIWIQVDFDGMLCDNILKLGHTTNVRCIIFFSVSNWKSVIILNKLFTDSGNT